MSSMNLRNQIQEEHLTCTICYNVFDKPKALPCLHTFCEHCLRDFVVSRGYESSGEFPCPICRQTVPIPSGGIEQFPDNFNVKSLLDTVDKTKSKTRPTPKPRRSLQPTAEVGEGGSGQGGAEQPHQPDTNVDTPLPDAPPVSDAPPPRPEAPPTANATPAPDVTPASYAPPLPDKWAGAGPPPVVYGGVGGHQPPPQYEPPPYYQAAYPHTVSPPQAGQRDPVAVGTHFQNLNIGGQQPSVPNVYGPPQPYVGANVYPNPYTGPALYPNVPRPPPEVPNPACSDGLQLRFGKKGASVTDFHKPFGLAVSDSCDFVVTDIGSNRIFIFDYQGQPKKAFHCEAQCRIRDVAINGRNEIVVVVNKPGTALRCYDMNGRFLGEHGKSITHDEPQGVANMWNGGVVVTGVQNHSVYILTDQYKLSSKFGRKGAGDGYFQSPAFVTSDSRGHIIVSDDVNHNIQVFNREGKFKFRFGGKGSNPGQLLQPKGIVTDLEDNIIVADSGNSRVEMFTSRGAHIRSVVTDTDKLGEDVRPVNVAVTPRGNIVVLLNGKYFAEVRVYGSQSNTTSQGAVSVKDSATWYLVN